VYQNKTPLAAENFKCLCTGEKGIGRMGKLLCYQGSKVHRIVPQFCVQMGDFTKGNGTGGESIYPPNSQHGDAWGKFKDELFMQHSKPGLLSMANSGKNTNSSQVFFTLRPVPHLDGKHVVFGEVVEGMDVIEALGMLETDSKQKPVHPVEISECGEVGIDVPSR
jgi:cyclophilin family peptidyl-prolyl cis-trans isomerase